MFLLLNWLLGAGGSISSYGWVQLRVQQQMGAQKTGGQGREYRTKPAGGPCVPLDSGFESKLHHWTTVNTCSLLYFI